MRKTLVIGLVVVGSCLLIGLVFALAEGGPGPKTAKDPQTATEQLLRESLSSSNRKVARLTKVFWSDPDKLLIVQWAINDNLSNDYIKRGAMIDATKLLKTVSTGIPYDYQKVQLNGTFALVDTFGNSTEEQVVSANYSRATLAKVNWDGFLSDNVYAIADAVWFDPNFQP